MSTRERLTRGDVRIEVLVDGRAGDPALVLLPSSLRDSLDFDDLAHRLVAAGLRVLRPQPRGIGGSHGPMDGLDLGVLAADVARTIEALGGGRAVVAGHAFGHFVARVTDLEHPAQVRGVAVLAGAARTFPPGVADTLAIASDPSRPAAERLDALRTGFFAPGNDPSVWLDGWHPDLREVYRRAGRTPAKDRWWPVSNAPILDLQGEHDPWRPPSTRDELRAALGGDRVTVRRIDGASHALSPERPAAVARAMIDWIATLPD
jgi:pimeloyl-ACP methyl ester carboxylesterase